MSALKPFLTSLFILILSESAFSGPSVSWRLKDDVVRQQRGCWTECSKRALGICVLTRRVCNNRSDYVRISWKGYDKIVKDAMNYLSREVARERFDTCTNDGALHAFGPEKKSSWSLALRDIRALAAVSKWPVINLHPMRLVGDESTVAGRADLERVVRSTSNTRISWNNDINVKINLNWVDDWKKSLGYTKTYRELAGIIFHELLHQAGHRHTDGYDDGNIMTVAGDCIGVLSNMSKIRGPNGNAKTSTTLNLTGTSSQPRRPRYD